MTPPPCASILCALSLPLPRSSHSSTTSTFAKITAGASTLPSQTSTRTVSRSPSIRGQTQPSQSRSVSNMTSHGQPPVVLKQSGSQGRITHSQLSTIAEGFQVARCIDGDILAQACARLDSLSYAHEIPSTHVSRATYAPSCRTFTRSHSTSTSSHTQGRSAKWWARSVLRERGCQTGGGRLRQADISVDDPR